jgi:hypothetical protein
MADFQEFNLTRRNISHVNINSPKFEIDKQYNPNDIDEITKLGPIVKTNDPEVIKILSEMKKLDQEEGLVGGKKRTKRRKSKKRKSKKRQSKRRKTKRT